MEISTRKEKADLLIQTSEYWQLTCFNCILFIHSIHDYSKPSLPFPDPLYDHPMKQTQLLVSVRNLTEAKAAISGGVDIVDLKEPGLGSLGAVHITERKRIIERLKGQVPITAALGELDDWYDRKTLLPRSKSPDEPDYQIAKVESSTIWLAKIGLAGYQNSEWQTLWKDFASHIREQGHHVTQTACPVTSSGNAALQQTTSSKSRNVLSHLSDAAPYESVQRSRLFPSQTRLVCVAYADWKIANSPSVENVANFAIAQKSEVFLIDTWAKTGQGLLDFISLNEAGSLVKRLQRHNILVALAGSIGQLEIRKLLPLNPDIIAVRTAACANGKRDAPVQKNAVGHLKQLLSRSVL